MSQPSTITLQDAMAAVGEGLVKLKGAEKGMTTGLLPSEVTIVFNVAAGSPDTAKLVLDLDTTSTTAVPIKIGGEVGTTATASRSNQVTVKLTNLLYAPKEQLVASMPPD